MLRILDHLATASIIYSPAEGIIAADERFAAIIQRGHDQLIGLTMEEITHADDTSANRWLIDQALRTGVPFVLRKRYVFDHRPPQWVENRYSILKLGSNSPLVAMLSRCVDGLAASNESVEIDALRYKAYIKNLAAGLADMARLSGNALATDLLLSAADVIETEDV